MFLNSYFIHNSAPHSLLVLLVPVRERGVHCQEAVLWRAPGLHGRLWRKCLLRGRGKMTQRCKEIKIGEQNSRRKMWKTHVTYFVLYKRRSWMSSFIFVGSQSIPSLWPVPVPAAGLLLLTRWDQAGGASLLKHTKIYMKDGLWHFLLQYVLTGRHG